MGFCQPIVCLGLILPTWFPSVESISETFGITSYSEVLSNIQRNRGAKKYKRCDDCITPVRPPLVSITHCSANLRSTTSPGSHLGKRCPKLTGTTKSTVSELPPPPSHCYKQLKGLILKMQFAALPSNTKTNVIVD